MRKWANLESACGFKFDDDETKLWFKNIWFMGYRIHLLFVLQR